MSRPLLMWQNQDWGWDIYIYPPEGYSFAKISTEDDGTRSLQVVTLDTGCSVGNWISWHLVKRLGMIHCIRSIKHHPDVSDIHGRRVVANGIISFRWRLLEGQSMHGPVDFYVYQDDYNGTEMIFGAKYIRDEKLLSSNRNRMLRLLSRGKPTSCKKGCLSLALRTADIASSRAEADV